jgi:hypothetical protein
MQISRKDSKTVEMPVSDIEMPVAVLTSRGLRRDGVERETLAV